MINSEIIKDRLESAKGIGWDTCHKIYILMDDDQMEVMQNYGYDPLISSNQFTPNQMFKIIQKWWDQSCGLKFISAVSTSEMCPIFETLIAQGEDQQQDEEAI